jgi:adenine phosphoribosyltransferase
MDFDLDVMRDRIRDIPDFPQAGVVFKDITPLLGDPVTFALCVEALAAPFVGARIDKVLGIEARGFILAAPVALRLGAGFVPVRKAGKLPWRVEKQSYGLEYGQDTLEIHVDALAPGERVLIVDDVLATGGTASAVVRLVDGLGGTTAGFACLIELAFLGGRARLPDIETLSILRYD